MFETLLTIDEQFVVSKVKQAELAKLTGNRHGDSEKISITKELLEEIKEVEYYYSKLRSELFS